MPFSENSDFEILTKILVKAQTNHQIADMLNMRVDGNGGRIVLENEAFNTIFKFDTDGNLTSLHPLFLNEP